jgi:hypothetical protein
MAPHGNGDVPGNDDKSAKRVTRQRVTVRVTADSPGDLHDLPDPADHLIVLGHLPMLPLVMLVTTVYWGIRPWTVLVIAVAGAVAVLALLAEGRCNSAIAQRLVISEKAVSKHCTSIFGKLDLPPSEDDNRRVLAVLAYLDR